MHRAALANAPQRRKQSHRSDGERPAHTVKPKCRIHDHRHAKVGHGAERMQGEDENHARNPQRNPSRHHNLKNLPGPCEIRRPLPRDGVKDERRDGRHARQHPQPPCAPEMPEAPKLHQGRR